MKVSLPPALPRQLVAALASSSSRGRRNEDGLASPFAKLISRQERKSEKTGDSPPLLSPHSRRLDLRRASAAMTLSFLAAS